MILLEAAPGPARGVVVQQWLAEAEQSGATTWLLNCAYEEGGVWAGLADLIQDLVPQIRERAPQLLIKHSYELCLVLPTLRRHLTVRNPNLTETVNKDEKTRNFPADRAYRSLHGVIDLLDAWHELGDGSPWAIVCDQYDRANGLVHRFFAELMRRRGQHLQLSLLVTAAPGNGDVAMSRFDPTMPAQHARLDLPSGSPTSVSEQDMTLLARQLEQLVEQDAVAREMHLPRLIRYWQESEFPQKALRWQIEAIAIYNERGLYEAGEVYSTAVAAGLDRLYVADRVGYTTAGFRLFFCYLLIGEVEDAQRIAERLLIGMDREDSLNLSHHLHYLMAMRHARYLPRRDLAKAEYHIQRSLEILSEVDLPEGDRHFYTVFAWNGLAFVRLRQGRSQEALELCRLGLERLEEHLPPDRHRLHRSVLLYNIAQVYAQLGPYEDAITYFGATMAMDPNYSEYYNERGNVYMSIGSLEEAEKDYLEAIELSPPYAEVWTNLGQCYRAMDRMADAAHAYSTALDLDPTVTLALVGRADAYTALELPEAALADYDAALALDPAQPLVLASRAILHYEAGQLLAALDDLNEAVVLAPDTAELYQNRAVALRDLGRTGEAAQDLGTYLRLCPDAEDRDEVEHTLLALQRSTVATSRS
ncbi:MAG: tetratricopeptide repeat protein [Egibacteraceae bacterium]